MMIMVIDNSDARTSLPLISIITVSFNAVTYIEQCIQSVITQSFEDFEYVIIDGGSDDGTQQIIEKYQHQLAYWHSKPDRGLAHAFNEGVKYSRGQWLLFLNSDDYFVDAGVLGRLAEAIQEHQEADVVFGQVLLVSREKYPKEIGGPYGGPFKWGQFVVRDTIPHQAALTNRKLFEQIGLFSEDFRIAVDYEHFLRAGPKLRACFVPILVAYMRDGGLSQANVRNSLNEWHKARIETNAAPYYWALLLHGWLIFRSFVGRYVKKCLEV